MCDIILAKATEGRQHGLKATRAHEEQAYWAGASIAETQNKAVNMTAQGRSVPVQDEKVGKEPATGFDYCLWGR